MKRLPRRAVPEMNFIDERKGPMPMLAFRAPQALIDLSRELRDAAGVKDLATLQRHIFSLGAAIFGWSLQRQPRIENVMRDLRMNQIEALVHLVDRGLKAYEEDVLGRSEQTKHRKK
jgi:hypothetical protein